MQGVIVHLTLIILSFQFLIIKAPRKLTASTHFVFSSTLGKVGTYYTAFSIMYEVNIMCNYKHTYMCMKMAIVNRHLIIYSRYIGIHMHYVNTTTEYKYIHIMQLPE